MRPPHVRDVEYWHDGTRMVGMLRAPATDEAPLPTVLLIHDAFGLGDDMLVVADRLVDAGHPVFLADVWGERTTPTSNDEIGPLIGSMAGDRDRWMARVAAAHAVLKEQAELDASAAPVVLGYCFGGSSALEYLRSGADIAGVIAIHPGLDLLTDDWREPGSAAVLICTGHDDPMATEQMRASLCSAMTTAAIDWQLHVYSDTTHAFTSPRAQNSPAPELFAYNARSAARAWDATTRFLRDITGDTNS